MTKGVIKFNLHSFMVFHNPLYAVSFYSVSEEVTCSFNRSKEEEDFLNLGESLLIYITADSVFLSDVRK